MKWSESNTKARIAASVEACKEIDIRRFSINDDLTKLKLTEAVVVDAVHVYVNIGNVLEMVTDQQDRESQRSHTRYLRFLHVLIWLADQILEKYDGIRVDFQSQRLHYIVPNPIGDRKTQVQIALAIASALSRGVRAGNLYSVSLSNAVIGIGVDAGGALAVHNGTLGDREGLFLGNPANFAAKYAALANNQFFLGVAAADAVGAKKDADQISRIGLLEADRLAHADEVTRISDEVLKTLWSKAESHVPLESFKFDNFPHPLLPGGLKTLGPASSLRGAVATIFADIDGFTSFVANAIRTENGRELAVRLMHCIRKELRDCIVDFGGVKVRYIGDCLHGMLSKNSSEHDSRHMLKTAIQASSAMHYGFAEVVRQLGAQQTGLGLQIGVDVGTVSVSRLGTRGRRSIVAVGSSVTNAEASQRVCQRGQTRLADAAAEIASDSGTTTMPAAPHRHPVDIALAEPITIRAYVEKNHHPYIAGEPLARGRSLRFDLDVPTGSSMLPLAIRWQVVNTGADAFAASGLRGSLDLPKDSQRINSQSESTSYRGVHSMRGYVFQGSRCTHVSPEFVVRIVDN